MNDTSFIFHLINGKTVIARMIENPEAEEQGLYMMSRPCELLTALRKDAPTAVMFVPYLSENNVLPPLETFGMPQDLVLMVRPAPENLSRGYIEQVCGIALAPGNARSSSGIALS